MKNTWILLAFILLPPLPALAQLPTGVLVTPFPGYVPQQKAQYTYAWNEPAESTFVLPSTWQQLNILSLETLSDGSAWAFGKFTISSGFSTEKQDRPDTLQLFGLRLRPEGMPDTTIGHRGWISFDFPPELHTQYQDFEGALQPDGKWVVACEMEEGIGVIRFLPDGRRDPSFRNGKALRFTDPLAADVQLQALQILPDGKIRFALVSQTEKQQQVCRVIQLLPDGSRDVSFDENGIKNLLEGPWLENFLFLPDGRMLLAAYRFGWIEIHRFLPDGTPDPSFGTAGSLLTRIELIQYTPFLHALSGGGMILSGVESLYCETGKLQNDYQTRIYDAAGRPTPFPSYESGTFVPLDDSSFASIRNLDGMNAIQRFRPDGSPIAKGGKTFECPFSPTEVVSAPDGKLLLASALDGKLLFVRLSPDGKPDPSFGLDSLSLAALGYHLAQQPEEKIHLKKLESPEEASPAFSLISVTGPLPSLFSINSLSENPSQPQTYDKEYSVEGAIRRAVRGLDVHLMLQSQDLDSLMPTLEMIPTERLTGLSLVNCRFKGPAEGLDRFRALKELGIYHDRDSIHLIADVERQLQILPHFPNLETLCLAVPSVQRLPDYIFQPALKELYLSYPCEEGIPGAIDRAVSLEVLEFVGPGPASHPLVPKSLKKLKALKSLRLKDIQHPLDLSAFLPSFPLLEVLEMTGPGFSSLPAQISSCPSLWKLIIRTTGSFAPLPEALFDLPDLSDIHIEVCQPTPDLAAQADRLLDLINEKGRWGVVRFYEQEKKNMGLPSSLLPPNLFTQTGLAARGVLKTPSIKDNSTKTGTVVVNICVNRKGRVVSAEYIPKGGPRPDEYLINLALESARKWVFEKSREKIQCGEITFRFQTR